MKVKPSNWDTSKASTKKHWHIWYRFVDPASSKYNTTGKLVIVKGMNDHKDIIKRREATRMILQKEIALIDDLGYNPVTEVYMKAQSLPAPAEEIATSPAATVVTPQTGLVAALEKALERTTKKCKPQLKSILKYLRPAAIKLGLDQLPISQVGRREIKRILEQIGLDKKTIPRQLKNGKNKLGVWTDNTYNHYLGHLGILFLELEEFDVFDISPTAKIRKKKYARPPRKTESDLVFNSVDATLFKEDYYFWRFLRIFQQSGCRRGEILGVHSGRVDIEKRTFSVLVEKGTMRYEEKYIDDEALPLWKEIMMEVAAVKRLSNPKGLLTYVFGGNLRVENREKPLLSEYVTKRWQAVKLSHNIDEKLYTRKHRRTTKDVDEFIEKTIERAQRKAARKNSHNTKMVAQVYDMKNKKRRLEIRMRLSGS